MKLLIIITAMTPRGVLQNTYFDEFDPPTRSAAFNWAYQKAGLDAFAKGQIAVTFFYAEPDEITP